MFVISVCAINQAAIIQVVEVNVLNIFKVSFLCHACLLDPPSSCAVIQILFEMNQHYHDFCLFVLFV